MGRALRGVVVACALAGCYHDAPVRPAQNLVVRRVPSYAAAIADPVGFLPIDSELVMSVDARAIRASALWQQYAPTLLGKFSAELAVFKDHCGVDPITAITRFSVGMRDLGSPHPGGVFVIHGLDRTKLMDCARKNLAAANPRARIEGDAIIVHPDAMDPQGVALQFVGDHTCVAVSGPGVDEHALGAVLASGVPLRASPAFTTLLERVDTHQALWFVLNGNAKVFDKAMALGVRPRAVWAWLAVRDGIAATLHVQLDSPAQAQQIVTQGQAQIAMVKPMVDDVSLTAEDADLVFSVSISDAKLQTLLGLTSGLFTP